MPEAPGRRTLCRASLNYAPAGGRGAGSPGPVAVDILDGRAASLPGWAECGFELVHHDSAVSDWADDTAICAVHYPEAEALARRVTGCDHALVSDHVRRMAEPAGPGRVQSPVRLVHSDFAAGYDAIVRTAYREVRGRGADTLARNGLTSADVEGAERIVMLQLWRNVGPARMDYPIAFCDARTVTPDEVRPFTYTGYVAGGRAFDALAVVAPPDPGRHSWYSFEEMTVDEVVVFRTYDTELVARGRTWFTPHSAYRDPTVPEGGPARASVELRIMCLFG